MTPALFPQPTTEPDLCADDGLPATQRLPVLRHSTAGGLLAVQDAVIEEVPVALVFNGVSHAVMLASPVDLADLALGFALSEGILTHPAQLYDLDVSPSCDGLSVEMTIATQRFVALKERRRNLAGRTGCGLCGVDSLSAVHRIPAGSVPAPLLPAPTPLALDAALHQLRPHQTLHQQTGAAHGAAWVSPAGDILCLREDVGRHNALDKLIGALARAGTSLREGFVLVTSRASYEMVQKVACAGGHTLVAVSAPTALAVRQAEAAGVLLIGFARPGQWSAYTQAERLVLAQPSN
ncbi:formate dehydrogenase accessory protein FdhD [Vitreoscilla filiformis]|uniref:Sulfur carrier protein FdhD n=1 Tax=Vitreoscilla filiformis TaxID=63 RepID=A0A221KAW1_VITFI|nr:formate dehydrogenase accessory sulfurtransferase FdhD [Vitreoscilla filiformis]ASM76152.1 formate dehydrogenase accessory protein FdhD [Vitreoscilla filiformis]